MSDVQKAILIPCAALLLQGTVAMAQDGGLDSANIFAGSPCFGLTTIDEPQALQICAALQTRQRVRARELSEAWVQEAPNSPGAQYALAEVLLEVEGNMPRAVHHLKRAEQLTGFDSLAAARNSDAMDWHFLTLFQLADVYLLMNEPLAALAYTDKLSRIYGLDMESARGWPLIKLKQYDAARASAMQVLENSSDPNQRARAWNTLCAADLAGLRPLESMTACGKAVDDEASGETGPVSIIDLTNAAEVSLSLLQIDRAQIYLQRATGMRNPRSVSNPWIPYLYLLLNQSRFDEAHAALGSMLSQRDMQEPLTHVMNRAEHYLAGAAFMLLAGYADDAARLTATALSQPDRTGSFSAEEQQIDAYAALMNHKANRARYHIALEEAATLPPLRALAARPAAWRLRFDAWRSARRAASLFAGLDTLQSRLRPYAPLDVHIPEWLEPDIVALVGSGVMRNVLEQARENGAFQLNDGYYYAYLAEISALDGNHRLTLEAGAAALSRLPTQEVLLRARLHGRMAAAGEGSSPVVGTSLSAAEHYARALLTDPGVLRRLDLSLPVHLSSDGSALAVHAERFLLRSPRFHRATTGTEALQLSIAAAPEPTACLRLPQGKVLGCYGIPAASESADSDAAETTDARTQAQALSREFHRRTFGMGYDISKTQRSRLRGSSVIFSSRPSPTPPLQR